MISMIFRGSIYDTVLSLPRQWYDLWWTDKDLEGSRRGLIDIPFWHYHRGQTVCRPEVKPSPFLTQDYSVETSSTKSTTAETVFGRHDYSWFTYTFFALFGQCSENWCSIPGRVRILSTVSRPTVNTSSLLLSNGETGLFPQRVTQTKVNKNWSCTFTPPSGTMSSRPDLDDDDDDNNNNTVITIII
jgi:hypothetical protein